VLLPSVENAGLAPVGGPGREFWVFGTNYTNDVDPGRLERSSMEPGACRIELSPKQAADEDLFLNVMQVTDRGSRSHYPVQRLETDARVGCLIEGPRITWLILMRRDNEQSAEPVEFTASGPNPHRILLTDLKPGRWLARREGFTETYDVMVHEDAGTAWLEGPSGTWTFTRRAE
jgi:heparin/heparan-sulfate lyase